MALSRPLLLALLGIALLGATLFAVQNARNTTAEDSTVAAPKTADPVSPAAPQPSAQAGPEQLLKASLTTDALKSASFDARVSFTSSGETNVIKTSGAFEIGGPKEMPKADVQVSVRVKSMNLNVAGGFVTTGDRAWFTRGNTGYAVPQYAWDKIVKAQESGAQPASDTPQLDVDPSDWLRNVKTEGKEQANGVEVTHISAEVDSAKAITDVVKAMSAAGEAANPLPNAERRIRNSGLTNGALDVWVGEDEILRRVSLQLSGKGDGGRKVDAALTLNLSGVNDPQDIARPAKVKNALPSGAYGQFANGVVAGLGNTVGVSADAMRLGVPVTNSHLKAERAVADHRRVVIFFQNPRALDDQAVADSVRSLKRNSKAVVLTDDVQNVDRYGSLVEDLGVNQAPAIVVIDRSGDATLIEGYIDAESLAQVVADAR